MLINENKIIAINTHDTENIIIKYFEENTTAFGKIHS